MENFKDMEVEFIVGDEVKVWNLVKKHPDELSFVLGCKNYEEYIETYEGLVNDISEVQPDLTKEEFDTLKAFFGDRE